MQIVIAFVQALPRLVLAWVAVLAVTASIFHAQKQRLRPAVMLLDAEVSGLARHLRFAQPAVKGRERMWLSWIFRFFTNLASAPSLSVLSLLLPWWALGRAQLDTGPVRLPGLVGLVGAWLFPGLCFVGAMLLSFVLKRIFQRERPLREGKAFGHRTRDPSFPSGHSLTSFAFWFGCSATLFATYGATGFACWFVLGAATIVLCTGLSRIYLGVHYASDVLGGYFIALVWCPVCYLILHALLKPIFV